MSDFLGHLVARSLKLETGPEAPAVRPRVASRFEPVEPTLTAPGWEESDQETVAPAGEAPWRGPVVREAVSLPEAARVEAPRPGPHPPGPPLPSPPLPPGEGGRRQGFERVLERETVFLPSPGGRGGDGRGAGGEVPRPEAHAAAPSSPTPSSASASISPSPGERGAGRWERGPGGEDSARNASRVSSEARPAPHPPEEKPRVEPAIRRVEIERVLTPVPSPPAPLAEPPRPAPAAPVPEPPPVFLQPRVEAVERDPFPMRREELAAQPVIQVTIGRIEVRATAAPKAPARERPAARPAVDLEEYLRQRARGEKR